MSHFFTVLMLFRFADIFGQHAGCITLVELHVLTLGFPLVHLSFYTLLMFQTYFFGVLIETCVLNPEFKR